MSIDRQMDKEDVAHIYNGILPSPKKNGIMPIAATWMQPEIIILSEVRKRKTGRHRMMPSHAEPETWHT